MKQINLNGAPFTLDNHELPVFIHGREGSGASFFSIILAVSYCRNGRPMLFWSAYPMAKEEFYKEFSGAIHRIKGAAEITGAEPQVIVMEDGDPKELAMALQKLDPGRIVFVKNFETLPEEIRSDLLRRQRLIISGDMENFLSKGEVAEFPTRIFFSSHPSADLPTLQKYEGFLLSSKKNGIIRVETLPKVVSISLPEYTIDVQPDYKAIGSRIDKVLSKNFEGTFLLRALSITDHPKYTLDELADIILKIGTDKYDPTRKGVDHEVFEPYQPDLQAGLVNMKNGEIIGESFGEDVRRFYENALLDRGYRLRIDLLVLYDPNQMVKAEKINDTKPGVEPHLEEYLWRFKDPNHKERALVGLLKILR